MLPLFGRTQLRLASLFLVLGALGSVSGAVEADEPWTVRVWTEADGLGGNNVRSVVQTPDGFLWIVATGKLTRFDGMRFESFSPADLIAGLKPGVRLASRLRDGGLGLVMMSGAIVRVGPSGTAVHATELPSGRAEALLEEESGALLISYDNDAIYRWREGKLTRLTERDGLPPGSGSRTGDGLPANAGINSVLTTDRQGRIWMARAGKVGIFREGSFQTLLHLPNVPMRLLGARDGGLWICAGLQLHKYTVNGTLRPMGRLPVNNPAARPTALFEDRAGGVWVGTSTSGLFRYGGLRFESVPISHRDVVNLTGDRDGNLWVGTSGGGLNLVQPRTITIEGRETGLPFRAVQAICEDPHGGLWAVTQEGSFVTRKNGTWQTVFSAMEGFGAEASCLAADASGAIWIGTRNHQLFRWHQGRLTSWGKEDGLLSSLIRTVVVSKSGDLWIGGGRPGALQRLRAGKIESVPMPETVDSIWAIAEDSRGHIWAGGARGLLLRVTPDLEVFDQLRRTNAPRHPIRALHAMNEGGLLIGYEQLGMGHLKDGTFKQLTTEHGLIDNHLRHIVADRQGWLWFISVQSVSKVRQRELDDFAEGKIAQLQPVQYGRDHGLHVILGNTVTPLLARDGQLWLPLATSLAIINPGLPHHEETSPPVLITRIAVDEQVTATYGGALPVPERKAIGESSLRLAPNHRRIDLDFTAMNFSAPKDVRFQYRLENFDQRWIDAGSDRQATYSRLNAGDYRFRVKARASDGPWSETGAELAFTVAPFLWDTWWFRGAMLVLVGSAVFGTTRYLSHRRFRSKLRALEHETAVERERARIARDIHDDLGSRLTRIVLLSRLATRDGNPPEKSAVHVREISETAQQVMKSLDETVWAVNPHNDNLPHLITYVSHFASKFLRTAETTCILDLPENPPQLHVSAEVRHNLYMAAKEALTNIVRHAQATEVRLSATATDHSLQILIEDNGRGFDAIAGSTGNGLGNMRQRINQIGGEFEIESRTGQGTRVSLKITWPRKK